jgi:hypothetical protein
VATVTEVRTWAVAEGNATSRGKLRAEVIDQWNADHPNDPYEPNPPRDGFTGNDGGPDYPADDFDSNFPDPGGTGDGLGDTGETPPRRPRTTAKKTAGFKNPFAKGKPKPGAKKQPRVSTADLVGAVWRGAAKMVPLPPLSRTLRMQSRVAGPIMDDVIRGTIVDPLLQPLARLAGQGKAVQALAGPPLFVTAIMAHTGHAAQAGEDPNPFVMAIAMEGLRSSLMAWMEIAGPKFAEVAAEEAEMEAKHGMNVDAMIALIFAEPPATAEESEAEEAAILRAQGIL